MRIRFCSSYTIRLFSKICWTKYVFPVWDPLPKVRIYGGNCIPDMVWLPWMQLLSAQLLLNVVQNKFSGEHISFLLLYVSGIQVVNQRSVYVKLGTWPFLAAFSFHHRINDVLDVNDYSCTYRRLGLSQTGQSLLCL